MCPKQELGNEGKAGCAALFRPDMGFWEQLAVSGRALPADSPVNLEL